MTEKSSPFLQMNAAPPSPKRKLGLMIGAVIGVLLLAILSAAVWWRFVVQGELIFKAVVDGQRAVVTARAEGRVTDVRVTADQVVSAGQDLIVLTPVPGADKSADAQAAVEAMRERVLAGEQVEKKAREELEQASLEHARRQLAVRGAGQPVPGSESSRLEHERLRAEERKARSDLEAAKKRSEVASLSRQSVESVYKQLREALRREQTENDKARTAHAILTSPMAGRVSVLGVTPGMQVRQGQTLAVIEPILAEHIWVTGFVRPGEVAKLRTDKVFTLYFPDHPELKLTGQVDAVQENAVGKDLPGIPVRLRLNGYDPLSMPRLGIGQTVEVREE